MRTPAEQPQGPTKAGAKSALIRNAYRKILRAPKLADKEIDDMRQHMIRLAQAVCEHVWAKRFY